MATLEVGFEEKKLLDGKSLFGCNVFKNSAGYKINDVQKER